MRDDSERSDDRYKYTEGRQAAGSQMGHGATHTHTRARVLAGTRVRIPVSLAPLLAG